MVQSVGIRLDPRRDEPLHRQLFEQIASRIRNGTYPSGYRLPPTRVLARDVGAHRNTVVRAYADLENAGFVLSTVGRGTFVASVQTTIQPSAEARARGALAWDSLLSRAADAEPLTRLDRASRTTPPNAINLSRLQPAPEFIPHELIRRCMDHMLRTQGGRTLSYAPREGLLRLRGLIAADLVRLGIPARAEDILVTTGSQQALDLLFRAFINPGDLYLVDENTYSGAINILAAAGARLVPIASDEEGPNLDALSRLSRSGAKGFYLMPNCGNPVGNCISARRREALVAWSSEAGIPLVEDDYCAELTYSETPMPPALRSLDGNVLYTGTYSKRLAPALRIGYVLCPPALQPRLLALKHALDLGTSALLQHVLAEFLERGYLRAHLGKIVPHYRRRRDALCDALSAHAPGLQIERPAAGMVMWVPIAPASRMDEVCNEARRAGVLVSPSTLTAATATARAGIRLCFTAEPPERLVEAARRLADVLAPPGRRSRAAPRTEGLSLGVA